MICGGTVRRDATMGAWPPSTRAPASNSRRSATSSAINGRWPSSRLRELAARTNVSNPYLSQIERGLHEPSVRVLKAIATALNVSAESLLTQAGLLEDEGTSATSSPAAPVSTSDTIAADPDLKPEQRTALLAVYQSYLEANEAEDDSRETRRSPGPRTRPGAPPRNPDGFGQAAFFVLADLAALAPRRAPAAAARPRRASPWRSRAGCRAPSGRTRSSARRRPWRREPRPSRARSDGLRAARPRRSRRSVRTASTAGSWTCSMTSSTWSWAVVMVSVMDGMRNDSWLCSGIGGSA